MFVSELEKGSQDTTSHRAPTGLMDSSRAVTVHLCKKVIKCGIVIHVLINKISTAQLRKTFNMLKTTLAGTKLKNSVSIIFMI